MTACYEVEHANKWNQNIRFEHIYFVGKLQAFANYSAQQPDHELKQIHLQLNIAMITMMNIASSHE